LLVFVDYPVSAYNVSQLYNNSWFEHGSLLSAVGGTRADMHVVDKYVLR
jgi:hypothetical protein